MVDLEFHIYNPWENNTQNNHMLLFLSLSLKTSHFSKFFLKLHIMKHKVNFKQITWKLNGRYGSD